MSILVTGANRGLGKLVAQNLAQNGNKVVFAGRDEQSLQELSSKFNNSTYVKLDVSSNQSILELPNRLREKGVHELTALVNNAAILRAGWNKENVEQILQTNLFGPLLLIETLLPSLQNGAKIVNVSSGLGQLREISANYRKKVEQSSTLEEVKQNAYFEEDEEIQSKYSPAYSVSKAFLNKATQLLAKDPRLTAKSIRVVSICPGWCKTDMGTQNAPREPELGAQSILWAVNHSDLPNGLFFRDGEAVEW